MDEDRQWDSGGGYQQPPPKTTSKKLPTIPMKQQRRPFSALEDSYLDRSTPTPRRKMPQIPTTRRSSSRQSFVLDNSGYRTPDSVVGHRGASLPPTPTKTPKVLPKITPKIVNSLPTTPGRQLPKPNQHRAKSKRNFLMKRTISAEYPDDEGVFDGFGGRMGGAVSAREMDNEDYYNWAYESIDDNLQNQNEEVFLMKPGGVGENPVLNDTRSAGLPYHQSIDDYYFNEDTRHENYQKPYSYGEKDNQVQKLEGGSDKKTLPANFQRANESVESQDDDYKDAYETTVPTNLNLNKATALSSTTILPANAMEKTQYLRDQSPHKAIEASVPSVTVVQVHNQVAKPQTRGVLKQQDSVDVTYLNQGPSIISYQQEYDSG